MAAPNEGTTNLPSDAASRYFVGLFGPDLNFYALRGDTHKSLQSVIYGPDGNPLLPTAVAIGDTDANPTTTAIAARATGWNGATWERLKSTNGQQQVRVFGQDGNPQASAARAAANGLGLPTTGDVLANILGYNGATMDLLQTLAPTGDGQGVLKTGNPIRTLTLLNALAITDTTEHFSAVFSIAGIAGKKTIAIASSLNQPITGVGLFLYNGTGAVARVANFTAQSITSNGAYLAGSAAATGALCVVLQVPPLDEPWQNIQFSVTCTVAPASGSVTATLAGQP